MMRTTITLTEEADIAYLTFVPETAGKPPTLDLAVLDELAACLTQIQTAGERLRAVIVRSAVEKYFIVGANIRALETLDSASIGPWVLRGHEVFNQLAALPLPVIALVEGYALGGGLELALACDLILATPTAQFGQPEAVLGLVPGWGGSRRLPQRIGLARAKQLCFTGQRIDAMQAAAWGLVDFVGAADALAAHLENVLTGVRSCSPLAVAQVKNLLNRSAADTLAASAAHEAAASQHCLADPQTQRRVAEFLAGRKHSRS